MHWLASEPQDYVRTMPHMGERTDAQVVRDVLSGDRDAFRLLVRRYEDVLYGHAVRMVGGEDEAAEIVQRAFVQGYTKLASCRDPDRVGAWLFRILSNLSRDHFRSRRRADVGLDQVSETPAGAGNPLEEAEREQMRGRLQAALSRLTPEQKEAFVMKHVEGRAYEEMAAILDVSVPSLKMRVHRAREALQDLLKEFQ